MASDETRQAPPPARLMELITGHWVTAAIHSAARLGLADQLADQVTKSSDQLAEEVGAHGPSIYRLLRALAGLGVFEEREDRHFALTPVGEHLRRDHPESMRDMALFQGAPPHWSAWGSFQHSIETGQSAFEHVHGMGFFDYCQTDRDFSEAFNGAMTGMSAAAAEMVVKAYDFSGIKKLCDVGGGHGYLISTILQQYPDLHGAVMDLPHVVEGAASPLERAGLANRCDLVGGDFFESVPPADAYISKHIIHDWDDEHSLKILRNMRRSMQGEGRVLLVEAVVPPGNEPFMGKLLDLEMLNSTHGGRERTEGDFADLFAAADLNLNRIVKTQSFFSIVEAVPA